MLGTSHHSAFDQWWEYAKDNYVSYRDGAPVGLDLYYDPVVDEHVAHGPVGIMAPTWYFAPQRPEVARVGWLTTAQAHGVFGSGRLVDLDVPAKVTSLLQFAGEFADVEVKERLWSAAAPYVEPTWDRGRGEFTLGFRLDEAHPRGQLNARAMAGWVCTPGAWSSIFNEPNLAKFDQPTVIDVDFPRVALSVARWDGRALQIAAQPQNEAMHGQLTRVRVTNLDSTAGWRVSGGDAARVELAVSGTDLELSLPADNKTIVLSC